MGKNLGVYLIQPGEYINTNVYKVGRSHNRDVEERIKTGYNKDTKIICLYATDETSFLETILINQFKIKFTKHKGREYFEGNINDMKKIFLDQCLHSCKVNYNKFLDDDDDISISSDDIILNDVKPKHYNNKIEPRDYITQNKLDFNEGNIIKYITRYKEKNGLEDLKKAQNYLNYLIGLYDT